MTDGTRRPRRLFADYHSVLTDNRSRVALLVALSLLGAAAEAASLVAITLLAVTASEGRTTIQKDTLGTSVEVGMLPAFAGTAALIAVRFFLGWATVNLSNHVVVSAAIGMRSRLMASFEHASWERKSQVERGRLQEIMTSHANNAVVGMSALVSFFIAATTVVVMISIAAVLDLRATLAIGLAGAALAFVLGPIRGATRRAATSAATAGEATATAVHETLRVARESEVFGVNDAVMGAFDRRLGVLATTTKRVRLLTGIVPIAYQTGAYAMLLLVIVVVYSFTSTSLASLAAVVLILVRTLSYTQQLVTSYQSVHASGPYAAEIDRTIAEFRADAVVNGGASVGSMSTIDFNGVSFQYPEGPRALSDVSLGIERGESIGIVGPSGSGKSTFVQLLLGLRSPTAGSITVGGRDLTELDRAEWRRRVAFVPQDSELIAASVVDNVRFFRSISEEEVRRACVLASLDSEIEQLPDGYHTLVGPGGHTFSGGQSQRLCLARALAAEPELLVLDEPTSALDAPTETAIAGALAEMKGHVTLVIVAHRLSTLRFCDRVVVLVGGVVESMGPEAQLRETSTFFRSATRMSDSFELLSGSNEQVDHP